MLSTVLCIEILIYMVCAVVFLWHLPEKLSWKDPLFLIIEIWTSMKKDKVNKAGRIIVEVLASVFTLRFALVGYVISALVLMLRFCRKIFYKLFTIPD